MRQIVSVPLAAAAGFLVAVLALEPRPAAGGGAGACASENGDVNADDKVDLADALTVLGYLFLGSPRQLVPLCAAPPVTGALPATGQKDCAVFDGEQGLWSVVPCGEATCPGQDGAHQVGCPIEGRFVDNGDGTVTDACTGLQWQKDTADVNDDGQSDLGDAVIWCEALNYCDSLSFAGSNDWRLPNVRELQSIVDYGRREPSSDPAFGTLPQYYWSSTTYAETPDAAWGIGFTVGYVGIRNKAGDLDFSFNFVRAVRGP